MTVMSLLELPEEVLLQIFHKLGRGELRNMMLTCKTLLDIIINDNAVWRKVFWPKLIVQRNSHVSFNRHPLQSLSMYQQCRISCNWRNGVFHEKHIIRHGINYMPWIQYHNEQYLLLTVGSVLKCYAIEPKDGRLRSRKPHWELEVPTILRCDVRTNDISRFILKDDSLVCGNRDGNMSIFKVGNIREKPRLVQCIDDCHNGGQAEVSAVESVNKPNLRCAVTASSKSSLLHFWDHRCNKSIRDIAVPYNFGLRCLATSHNNEKLAVGLNGNTRPSVLDIETGDALLSPDPEVHKRLAIRDLQWHDSNIVTYVTYSGTVRCIDLRSNNFVCKFNDPFASSLYCVKTDGHHAIVTGTSQHSRSVLFDMRFCGHVQTYFACKKGSPVYSLDFDSTKLIVAGDMHVSVLNFNVSASTKRRDYSKPFEFVHS